MLAPHPSLPTQLGTMLTLCAPLGPQKDDGHLRPLPGQVPLQPWGHDTLRTEQGWD